MDWKRSQRNNGNKDDNDDDDDDGQGTGDNNYFLDLLPIKYLHLF